VLDWLARLQSNNERNRVAFPTYATFTATGTGAVAGLNLWSQGEQVLWRKDIAA
jgi:hypothetical protein